MAYKKSTKEEYLTPGEKKLYKEILTKETENIGNVIIEKSNGYYVYCCEKEKPTKIHDTYWEAKEEAMKLAKRNLGLSFSILEILNEFIGVVCVKEVKNG